MERKTAAVVVVFLCVAAAARCSADGGQGPFFGANLVWNSKYMWRGIELNEDPVFQPEAWLSYRGFTALVWANVELTDIYDGHNGNGEQGDVTEIDYMFEYAASYRNITGTLGYIHYDFPKTDWHHTQEIYLFLDYDGFLSPRISVYRDVGISDGWYFSLACGYDMHMKKLFDSVLTTRVTVGYSTSNHSRTWYGKDEDLLSDVLATVALAVPLGPSVRLIPSVNYTGLLDGALRGGYLNKRDDTVWFGVKLELSFGG